jgi:hypothetical protein
VCNLVLYLLMEKGHFKKSGEGYPIIILGHFIFFYFLLFAFACVYFAAGAERVGAPGP